MDSLARPVIVWLRLRAWDNLPLSTLRFDNGAFSSSRALASLLEHGRVGHGQRVFDEAGYFAASKFLSRRSGSRRVALFANAFLLVAAFAMKDAGESFSHLHGFFERLRQSVFSVFNLIKDSLAVAWR